MQPNNTEPIWKPSEIIQTHKYIITVQTRCIEISSRLTDVSIYKHAYAKMLLLCWSKCVIAQKNAYELLNHTWSSSVISINAGTLILLSILRAQTRIHARSLGSQAGRGTTRLPVMLAYFRVTDLKGQWSYANLNKSVYPKQTVSYAIIYWPPWLYKSICCCFSVEQKWRH